MTFACTRCGYRSQQPAHVIAMTHRCTPPGRPAKVQPLIAVGDDGETNNQKPTRSTQKP